jgi:putative ABC transport system ATP-binding protein
MAVIEGDRTRSDAILAAHELYRFYHTGDDETLALRGVSLRVLAGEAVAIVGPSGSGKSTLLACLCGIDEPDGGFVTVMNQRITRRPEPERAAIRAKSIGMLLQSGNLFDHLSVEDNVRLQLDLRRAKPREGPEYLLDTVGLAHRRRARPSQLSGGEAARAGLAVALAAAPPLLLADEPTAEVDAMTEQRVLGLLDEHRHAGGAAIVATHSHAVAAWADRVIRLADGRFVDA